MAIPVRATSPMLRRAYPLCGLGGETDTRCALGLVENNELTLEENVTEDGDANTVAGLDATEAIRSTSSCVVDVFTGNNGLVRTDTEGEVRESGRAGENVSTLTFVIFGSFDSLVVCGDGVIGYKKEGGSGVSDGVKAGGLEWSTADAVTWTCELPETFGIIYIGVGDRASVLAVVDSTKVIGTSGVVFEVSSEEGLTERWLGVVEKGILWSWGNCT